MNQRGSSLGMASLKKSWRSIWCSPVQFEDPCHWRHRLSLSGIHNVTNHAISKFREELIKDRSRYIEKVTGNGVLLIAINACLFVMFVEDERYIPKIASPQKLRLGKSLLQAQTLIGLKRWLYFFFIVAAFFFVYFIHSQYHFFYWLESAEHKQSNSLVGTLYHVDRQKRFILVKPNAPCGLVIWVSKPTWVLPRILYCSKNLERRKAKTPPRAFE